MQTILGASGVIGRGLARELTAYTDQIRVVGRNPVKVNPGDQIMKADLTLLSETDKAVAGSEVVYLTAGIEYKATAWQQQWPVIMRNVIESCKKHGARLVFFDNVYMYDRDFLDHMTEETPIRPSSKKGEVRAKIAAMLMDEVKAGNLNALIARSADFIGPGNSILIELVYNNYIKGKKANWFSDAGKIHSFTDTTDAARGTAMLGNTPEAYNQIWHLPTSAEKLTGKEWINLFAQEMKVKPAYSTMPGFMLSVLGIFIPILKEVKEMDYQYDRDYFFDSTKFNSYFGYVPSKTGDSVKSLVKTLQGR